MAEEEEVETGEETEVEPKETEGETSETPTYALNVVGNSGPSRL